MKSSHSISTQGRIAPFHWFEIAVTLAVNMAVNLTAARAAARAMTSGNIGNHVIVIAVVVSANVMQQRTTLIECNHNTQIQRHGCGYIVWVLRWILTQPLSITTRRTSKMNNS